MRRKRLAKALAGAAAAMMLGLALTACGGGDPGNTIVLYNGQHPQLTDALVQAFTRQTHINVRVRTADGIVLADQLLQEGNASPADVYLTENSPELMNLEAHGLMAKLPADILSQIPARESSPTGDWVGVALRVSTLVYDPSKVSRSQLPTSVLQLAQPQWKGRVAIAPTDSDFPPVVGAVIATHGKAAATQWLDGLKRNAQLYQDDESVVAAVNRGAVATGIINHYYWYRLRLELGANNMHSQLYFFPNHDPGSIQNIAGAAVLASSHHRSDAQALVRFITSATGQRILAAGDDFEYPARPGVAPNPAVPPLASISSLSLSPTALGTDQTAVQLIEQAGLD
ncbi:MAG TPA: extracellular solute-binding protein [Solirubrobacteraceae bacterium]|nr:extracellular solute-binding protein [Solirubrobacteraceae bacterium]